MESHEISRNLMKSHELMSLQSRPRPPDHPQGGRIDNLPVRKQASKRASKRAIKCASKCASKRKQVQTSIKQALQSARRRKQARKGSRHRSKFCLPGFQFSPFSKSIMFLLIPPRRQAASRATSHTIFVSAPASKENPRKMTS